MIQAKWIPGNEEHSECLALRKAVFVSELTLASDEKDWIDEYALHALVYDGGTTLATGRIYGVEKGVLKIDSLCVASNKRGEKLGDLTMRMLLYKAQELGATWIVTETCDKAREFYAKYGFKPDGEAGGENGAALFTMKLATKDIKRSCKGCNHIV